MQVTARRITAAIYDDGSRLGALQSCGVRKEASPFAAHLHADERASGIACPANRVRSNEPHAARTARLRWHSSTPLSHTHHGKANEWTQLSVSAIHLRVGLVWLFLNSSDKRDVLKI
jgi:hypothetical protein